jgi:hypothetical protein
MNDAQSTGNFHSQFCSWLDAVLSEDLPEGILGFAINLYEGPSTWGAELVGTPTFDEDDEDWACDDIYMSTRLEIPHECIAAGWERALDDVAKSLQAYLSTESLGANKLMAAKGIGVGFVEGNLILINGSAT